MTKFYFRLIYTFLACVTMLLPLAEAKAFPTELYTTESALAKGNWMKISVSQTGIHFISASTLRSWGFSDISKVRIHGYGGYRLPDKLTASTFIDDLPEVSTVRTSQGIYFYGVGIVSWSDGTKNIYQSLNPYSTEGYYFVTSGTDEPASVDRKGSSVQGLSPVKQFTSCLFYEVDQYSLGQSGTVYLGDDFRYTRSRDYKFQLKDYVENESAWIKVTFATNTTSASAINISANGTSLIANRQIPATSDNYGTYVSMQKRFEPTDENTTVNITLNATGTVSAAHLDAITFNYTRKLRLDDGLLEFTLSSTAAMLEGADADTHVWDVTNPTTPIEMETTVSDGGVTWVNEYTGTRNYIAWNDNARLLTPRAVGNVPHQNIHGITDTPDMVIITVKDFVGEAERVANLHRRTPDNFNVIVLTQDDIFNEFSSGLRDPGAFRKALKMFYDRGNAAGHPLRYCLLFGRPLYDARQVTTEAKNVTTPFMPVWQTSESFSVSGTYPSDDINVMLDDDSGGAIPLERISIAIGRISAATLSQAKTYVDKLYTYNENLSHGEWKNNILLEADNGNDAQFMVGNVNSSLRTGLEGFYDNMLSGNDGQQFIYNKIYYDTYPVTGGYCAQADTRFTRALDEGVMLWIFNGHGAQNTLASEGLHTKTKINNMYNTRWPIFLGMTCSFGRWDNSDISGMETMAFNSEGGIIAAIASTRQAAIPGNDGFIMALGNHMMRRDDSGEFLRFGDMVTNSKNSIRSISNTSSATTKLGYATFGDPAMRLVIPSNTIILENVSGEDVNEDSQVTIKARQRVTLNGSIFANDGSPLSDFNGTLHATLYDAERSVTTLGQAADGTTGKSITYDEMGDRLYAGRGEIVNGQFSLNLSMPAEVADNFRPATLNLYATSTDGREATGVCHDLYVYGYDYDAEPDSLAPNIDYAYLNHPSFKNGDIVNEQPMFIAGVSDDVAINLSMSGIGHQMSLKLDDSHSYSDVSFYYTPSSDGSAGGSIAYPISDLEEGNHTLTFRVWDTSGNSASRSVDFFVERGATPQLFDIYSDANPASTEANFYISHNRPNAPATVTLEIYNLSGRRIWTSTVSGRSDMFLSAPIQWNLCDMGGQRVIRGIYIYRATLTIDGYEMTTPAKRIAVTGR